MQTYFLEATTSRQAAKARDDAKHLANAITEARKQDPSRQYTGWLVTKDEPSPEQRAAVIDVCSKRNGINITILSFRLFTAQLADGTAYIAARRSYRFGSVHDPETGNAAPRTPYVESQLYSPSQQTSESASALISKIAAVLRDTDIDKSYGVRAVILGDYGMGKSMLLRDMFLRLADRYVSDKLPTFPVVLNLRDHHTQDDPSEALIRHARRVGLTDSAGLIRAWRGGFTTLLLDGFDEISPDAWGGKATKPSQFRFRACVLIRRFIEESPPSTSIIVAGRDGFFDTDTEMWQAFGVTKNFEKLTLTEFSIDQLKQYLSHLGASSSVPTWMPRRPLLVGYLAARRLLDVLPQLGTSLPAEGWSTLLDLVCEREAQIDPGLDGGTVRSLVERLATFARRSTDGLGPLTLDQLRRAYEDVCGYPPADNGEQLLLRLFCLSRAAGQADARQFVDTDVADVARAGDVREYIKQNGHGDALDYLTWNRSLGELGIEVLANSIVANAFTAKQVYAAAHTAIREHSADSLASEIVIAASRAGLDSDDDGLLIQRCEAPPISLDDVSGSMSNITFDTCIVPILRISSADVCSRLPKFINACLIGKVEGDIVRSQVSSGVFGPDVEITSWTDDAGTNASILELKIPLGQRVLITALRKLFVQRGSARKVGAFYRGMDVGARELVDDVIVLLVKYEFASHTKQGGQVLLVPNRNMSGIAQRIVGNPGNPCHPIVDESALL
ncbi:MAG: NACHT domain-containing protein [Phycisphaeraceae bacterium]|nr:NACHT domain-containing protein [Phycisphaeraceae bacterium]